MSNTLHQRLAAQIGNLHVENAVLAEQRDQAIKAGNDLKTKFDAVKEEFEKLKLSVSASEVETLKEAAE